MEVLEVVVLVLPNQQESWDRTIRVQAQWALLCREYFRNITDNKVQIIEAADCSKQLESLLN